MPFALASKMRVAAAVARLGETLVRLDRRIDAHQAFLSAQASGWNRGSGASTDVRSLTLSSFNDPLAGWAPPKRNDGRPRSRRGEDVFDEAPGAVR